MLGEDDLFIPAHRATRLVDNIVAYMTGDPQDDAGWTEMSMRLDAVLQELVKTLQENDLQAPEYDSLYPNNPFVF